LLRDVRIKYAPNQVKKTVVGKPTRTISWGGEELAESDPKRSAALEKKRTPNPRQSAKTRAGFGVMIQGSAPLRRLGKGAASAIRSLFRGKCLLFVGPAESRNVLSAEDQKKERRRSSYMVVGKMERRFHSSSAKRWRKKECLLPPYLANEDASLARRIALMFPSASSPGGGEAFSNFYPALGGRSAY